MCKSRGRGSGVGGQESIKAKPASGPRPLTPALIAFFLLVGCQGADTPSPSLPAGVINISNNNTISIAPSAAASGNTVYVAWTDRVGAQNMEVFLSRSQDAGATFGAPINVSQSADFSGNPKLAISGTSVYVVWEEFIPTSAPENNESDIFFRRGDEQSGTLIWTPPLSSPARNLSASPPICGLPATKGPCPSQGAAIAVTGNNVFVAWGEATDYVISPVTIGQSATQFNLINSNILMAESFDNGVNFNAPIVITEDKADATLSPSLNPTLATAGGALYIAWEDFTQPNSKILFRRAPDPINGAFIPSLTQPATALSGSIKGSSRPSLAAEGGTVFLLWEGFPSPDSQCPLLGVDGNPLPNSEILLIRSSDQAVNFTEPGKLVESNLSNNPCSSNNGKLALSGAFVSAAWEDNTPGLNGISLRRSGNGGLSFGSTMNLSQTGGSVANPTLAASGGDLFAFWEDATLGNLEIFFAHTVLK